VQVPETDALELSGPAYVIDVQLAIPDTPSEPVNVIGTGWLYHPFESGSRPADAPVTAGADASFLIVTDS
jgi:hypothetical protein